MRKQLYSTGQKLRKIGKVFRTKLQKLRKISRKSLFLIIFKENMLIDDFQNFFGDGAEHGFINFYNQLENNNFPKQRVKNFYYFQIGRWDLQLLNDQIIKFPVSKIANAIQQSVELLTRKDFGNYNVIDLRIHGSIIVE